MDLLCIDIGNTHTHYGVVGPHGTSIQGSVMTPLLDDPQEGLSHQLTTLFEAQPRIDGIAFCSVVPAINWRLQEVLANASKRPVFQLTHKNKIGVPISYPQPAEIGQDRLANAAAAHALGGSPAIVIDSGTAVTFDIITTKGGYEGGIIAPGLELTRRYLHDRTAQLPLLDDSLEIKSVIGKSTTEAMRIGTVIGFPGLIQALLDAVLADIKTCGEPAPHLFVTGGNAAFLQSCLKPHLQFIPDLTLRGLAAAYWLNNP